MAKSYRRVIWSMPTSNEMALVIPVRTVIPNAKPPVSVRVELRCSSCKLLTGSKKLKGITGFTCKPKVVTPS